MPALDKRKVSEPDKTKCKLLAFINFIPEAFQRGDGKINDSGLKCIVLSRI
jgi:hypothetical protein